MTTRDRSLAVLVAITWGLNFLAIYASLEHFPPMFCVALRFGLIAIPTVLLVPRPDVELRWLIGYGAGFGIAQFVFLYAGMSAGMPTGLASLVLQASAPFTVVLAGVLLRERLSGRQVVGILLAIAGLAGVAWHRSQTAALLPVVLTLLAALGWAFGNLANRQAKPSNPLHLTLWMAVVPPVPMLAFSLLVEGPERVGTSLATAFTAEALPALLGVAYTVVIATVVGSGLWTMLMTRYPSSTVAPFSMLVPVVGMSAGALVLHERLDPFELASGAVVIAGVLLGSTRGGLGRAARRRRKGAPATGQPATGQAGTTSCASRPLGPSTSSNRTD
ncbi:EamA family transporter [Mumia zhuanghuii]|uniref:EamA family transporter n=1 Tax=Mumia zhuanghuii TaxID=2585211 RepID=A0A5C4MM28_9ACTN|nr:EamA family transporter [Mumia zhuanghuii]TNC46200.1 EamA family transporter [Mumia zhuanghuii]TNC46383.1 EamA family transporter [Mumia zhuanghuii]